MALMSRSYHNCGLPVPMQHRDAVDHFRVGLSTLKTLGQSTSHPLANSRPC